MNAATAKEVRVPNTGPFDSLRDYLAAVEARDRLLRIAEMDLDRFEATGFAYRLVDEFGFDDAPPFLIERVRISGEWMDGPVIGNVFGGWDNEALAFGAAPDTGDAYRAAFDRLHTIYTRNDGWPRIPPVEIDGTDAPCKQVVIAGDDVDLYRFPWVHTNPGDAAAYITAGTVFVEDPDLGRNVATYRCQLKDSTRIGVNMENGQNAWSILQKYRQRGQQTMPAAVVIGADPVTFAVGTSKMAPTRRRRTRICGWAARQTGRNRPLRNQRRAGTGTRGDRDRRRNLGDGNRTGRSLW